jgi:hypothetical protein
MLNAVFRGLAAIGVFVIGCYADPDYRETRFRCDATHGCPMDQICVAGACTGGGPAASASVLCGATACASDQKCCAEFIGPTRCTALAESCTGVEATCDGVEDCNGGPCCADTTGLSISCGTACEDQICRDPADCTNAAAKACCFDDGLPGEPWGHCRSACGP